MKCRLWKLSKTDVFALLSDLRTRFPSWTSTMLQAGLWRKPSTNSMDKRKLFSSSAMWSQRSRSKVVYTQTHRRIKSACIHTHTTAESSYCENGPLSSSQCTNTGGEPYMSDYTAIGGDIALLNVFELDLSVFVRLCHSSNKQVCPQETCGTDKLSVMGQKNAWLLTWHASFSCCY